MSFISIYLIQLSFSIFSILFAWGNKNYMLGDGLSVLGYICSDSWKYSRQTSNVITNFISNGIYSFIYPKWMHCGLEPPHILLFLTNQIFIGFTLYLACRYIKNMLMRYIVLLSIIYSAYSSGVASKEAFLTFILILLSIQFIKSNNENESFERSPNFKRKSRNRFLFSFLLVTILSLSRLTYIILIPAIFYIFISNSKIKNNKLKRKVSLLLILIYLILPFLINIKFLSFIFGFGGDLGLILNDYILRFQAYSSESSEQVEFLKSNLAISGVFYKILVTIFGYRHILMSFMQKDLPLSLAHLSIKISVAFTTILSYFEIFKLLGNSNSRNKLSSQKNVNGAILIAANLACVFIYPYPHERYLLPGVIFSLVIISTSFSRYNQKHLSI